MSNPQQPELRRSGETPSLTPDAIAGELKARDRPTSSGTDGHPVPPQNKAGSPSGPVQDKPDLDKFAAKLGADKGDGTGHADRDAAGDDAHPLADIGVAAIRRTERPIAATARLVSSGARVVGSAAERVAAAAERVAEDHGPDHDTDHDRDRRS